MKESLCFKGIIADMRIHDIVDDTWELVVDDKVVVIGTREQIMERYDIVNEKARLLMGGGK